MSAPALRTEGLTKLYGERAAVKDVGIELLRGEVYGFVGPNGAGKTTTMRMLAGLVRPSSGRAEVLGRAPGDPAGLARLGALIESPNFYPYLSGRDNLRVLAGHAGVRRGRVAEVLELAGLAGRAGDRVGRYSLGMKQRLGVAAALLKDPELLILDEPTNGLDPLGMADMRRLVRRLGDEGRAVLLSSHNLADVQEICDRVGVILAGRMVSQSTVGELRGAAVLVLRASPPERARRLLEAEVGPQKVSLEGDLVRLAVSPDRAASLNRRLVAAGVDVHELRAEERSLEQAFLALSAGGAGGGPHVA